MTVDLFKPQAGEPCNGCGICCRITICMHGTYWLGLGEFGERVPGPCPASLLRDGRFQCGLVLFPKRYIKSPLDDAKLREALKVLIGSGRGCDSVGYFSTEEEERKVDDLNFETSNDPEAMQKIRAAIRFIYNK